MMLHEKSEGYSVKERRLIKMRCKLIVPIKMKIGPCTCTKNLPMEASSVYLNYLVTAALWPWVYVQYFIYYVKYFTDFKSKYLKSPRKRKNLIRQTPLWPLTLKWPPRTLLSSRRIRGYTTFWIIGDIAT